MPPRKLLLITNHAGVPMENEWREALSDFEAIPVAGVLEARGTIGRGEIDCILVKGIIPDSDHAALLEVLHRLDPILPVVFYDPEMTAAEAVRLVRSGAYHCLGFRDSVAALRDCLRNAAEEKRFHAKAHRRSATPELWRDFLVGESRAMQTVADTIRLIGPRRCTVLITGESGTGKELAARAIHMASSRAGQALVAVNCTALPEHLLEAELFGHVRGAFTGAINARVGRFEQANRGTLFLDEIGDMPIELQSKLLRVLQDREIQRLGSSENIKVDVRVIAASNVNLLERVQKGKFREDLYYRLNVVPLHMPPLREHDEDIPVLVYHFVRKICQMEGIPLRRLAPEVLDLLRTSAWPGNVRQLENTVEKAIAMSGDRDMLYPRDFGVAEVSLDKVVPIDFQAPDVPPGEPVNFETAVSQFQRAMLEQALIKTGGNKTAAAELLGLKRTTLIMKLRSFEMSDELQAV
ncbi:MAG TPA: sigma-54 dependent transcriptional regulator [Bryobacteraceae bacterium]|nr:sigma-54 dependent transcriptional regulator [Bryobacteraceae bacterium]